MSKYIKSINRIEKLLPKTLTRDARRFRQEIGRLKKEMIGAKEGEKLEKRVAQLEKAVHAGISRRRARVANLPELSFDPALPITSRKDEIIDTIRKNRVVIISGETGSGKTTQLPKLCLAAGRGIDGRIACTQPRRIAAVSVTSRIAEELASEPGEAVGYKIRFQDRTSPSAYIKLMTDGILLAETLSDPWLNEYDTIIVDEAHERSLNIDFILGILRTLLDRRRDLKVIVTSATIDTEKFSEAFGGAPVIEVSGRTFPVEVRYQSPEESGMPEEASHADLAVRATEKLIMESARGDILIFMPTEQDIRETCELLEGSARPGITVVPLFARLSAPQQARVFSSGPGRKIIVATNIAETSITIPGIKYVVDTGLARIAKYNPGTRTTALPVTPIAKSSADQRKGRCGRVENGICIRLYSEEDYESRPLYTPPEILRSNLAEVILRMVSLKLDDIHAFPFIDRPAPRSIKDGFDTLFELAAISERKPAAGKKKSKRRYFLTENGRVMARLPIDPKLSRMLIESSREGCLAETLVIASALSISDPRDRPQEKAQQADQKHALYKDPSSDFLSYLKLWDKYHEHRKQVKSLSKMKKYCTEHFLSFKRMREFRDIHHQLALILKEQGFDCEKRSTLPADASGNQAFGDLYTAIHKSILTGFLSNIAFKKEKNIYQAAKGRQVMLFPGSGLFNKAGQWVVAGEMVETSRLFARQVANIDLSWLEALGKELCKYSHSEPHWERKRGEVVAAEQVTLFGIVLVSGRTVSFGKINPEEASEIFIRSALVEGDLDLGRLPKSFAFIRANLKLMAGVQKMEDRVRRRDILVSEEDIYEFYRERLAGFSDIRSLGKFLKDKDDTFLKMTEADLLRYRPDEDEISLYPARIDLGGENFRCDYRFEPGKAVDGVTVRIPESHAAAVPAAPMEWLVPGLYREKVEALIKGLPKEYRKKLVPVSGTVETIVAEMPKEEGRLLTALGHFIHKRFGVDIPAPVWTSAELAEHLTMRVSIVDAAGRELRAGRGATALRSVVEDGRSDEDRFSAALKEWEKEGITCWDFGDLPESLQLSGNSKERWTVFPALAREAAGVALRLFREKAKAAASHVDGVSALFEQHFSKDLKSLRKDLTLSCELKPKANYLGGQKTFEGHLLRSVVNRLFRENIREEAVFAAHAHAISPTIYRTGQAQLALATEILTAFHEARTTIYNLELSAKRNQFILAFLEQLRGELASLLPENFMTLYEPARLVHTARYVRGVAIRASRGCDNMDKEKVKANDLLPHMTTLGNLVASLTDDTSGEKRVRVENYFWMLEEYKVSIFAQELKTAVPVSSKRLRKLAEEIRRMI